LAEELLDLELQVFMTGTDENLFSDFGDKAQILKIADNRVHT
jgi:recombinational DNA repair ATPase RecF